MPARTADGATRGIPGTTLPTGEVRPAASSGGVTALLVALAAGVHAQGGYGGVGPLLIGVPLLVAVLLVRPGRGRRAGRLAGRPWRVAVPVLLLGAWAVVDGALHGDPAAGLGALVLAAGVATVLFVVAGLDDAGRGLLLDGLAGVGALLGLFTWAGSVLRLPGWALTAAGLWRSGGTVGYANAAAAVLVLLLLLTAAGRERDAARPLAPGTVRLLGVAMVAGLAATLSRGGLLALVAGLAVPVLAGALRLRHRVRDDRLPFLSPALAGGAVAAAGLVPSVSVHSAPNPLLAAAALAAGLAVAWLAQVAPWRWVPGAALGGAALAAAAVAAAGALLRTRAEAGPANRDSALAAGWRLFTDRSLLGTGPGDAVLRWHDGAGGHALRLLHDEYAQVALELGLVGALLLLAVLAGWLAESLAALRGPARVAAVAAGVAFAVHSGLDILWHVPVLPLLAAAALALAGPTNPPPYGGVEPTEASEHANEGALP